MVLPFDNSGSLGTPTGQIRIDISDLIRARQAVQEESERMKSAMERNLASLESFGRGFQTIAAGSGVITALGTAAASSVEQIRTRYLNLIGTQREADRTMAFIAQRARELNAPVIDAEQAMTRLLTITGRTEGEMDRLVSLVVRLASIDPGTGGGIQGAAFAISEAISSGGSDLVSLVERFGVSRVQLREAIAANGGDFAAGLDAMLNRMGANEEAVKRYGSTFQGALRNARAAFQELLANGFTPTLNALTGLITGAADFVNHLNQSAPVVTGLAGSLISVVAIASTLVVVTGQIATNLTALRALGILSGIGSAVSAVAGFGPLAAIGTAAASIVAPLGAAAAGFVAVAAPIALLVGGLAAVITVVDQLNRSADEARNRALAPLREELTQMTDELTRRLSGIPEIDPTKPLSDKGVSVAQQAIDKGQQQIQVGFTDTLTDTRSQLDQMLQPLIDFINSPSANLENVAIALREAGVSERDYMEIIQQAQQGTLTISDLLSRVAVDKLPQVTNAILGAGATTSQAIQEIVTTLLNAGSQINDAQQDINAAQSAIASAPAPVATRTTGRGDFSRFPRQPTDEDRSMFGDLVSALRDRATSLLGENGLNGIFGAISQLNQIRSDLQTEQYNVAGARNLADQRDAFDVYQRRLETLIDHDRQMAEMQRQQLEQETAAAARIDQIDSEAQQQRQTKLSTAYQAEKRALEDHLSRMADLQRTADRALLDARRNRDVDAAVRAIEQYKDASEKENKQYATAKQRRDEDLQQTLVSMQEQTDARRQAAIQQLADLRAANQRQREQSEQSFRDQLNREDFWRNLQRQRQQEDRAREDYERVAAGNRRIQQLLNTLAQENSLLALGGNRFIQFIQGIVSNIPGGYVQNLQGTTQAPIQFPPLNALPTTYQPGGYNTTSNNTVNIHTPDSIQTIRNISREEAVGLLRQVWAD